MEVFSKKKFNLLCLSALLSVDHIYKTTSSKSRF